MGCCASRKGEEEAFAPDQLSVTQSTLYSLELLIDLLQSQNPALGPIPHFEALILFLSKIHLILTKELLEPLRLHGNAVQGKNLIALRELRQEIEGLSAQLKTQLPNSNASSSEKSRESAIKVMEDSQPKIFRISELLQEVSQKALTVFFPEYGENAQGMSASNFVSGYERILSREKAIETDLRGKAEGFRSCVAAEFWENCFKGKNSVTFAEFEKKFCLMTAQMHKHNLNGDEVNLVRNALGATVEKQALDDFIWKQWNVWFKRKEILGK